MSFIDLSLKECDSLSSHQSNMPNFETTVNQSFAEKFNETLQNCGMEDVLLPDSDVIGLMREHSEFTEWFSRVISPLHCTSLAELEAFKTVTNIEDNEVDKLLQEKLGNQKKKISLVKDTVNHMQEREEELRMKLSMVEPLVKCLNNELEECRRNKKSLQDENNKLSQEMLETLSSLENLPIEISNCFMKLPQLTFLDQFSLLDNTQGLNKCAELVSFLELFNELFEKCNCFETHSQNFKRELVDGDGLLYLMSRCKQNEIDQHDFNTGYKLCDKSENWTKDCLNLQELFEKGLLNKLTHLEIVSRLLKMILTNIDVSTNQVIVDRNELMKLMEPPDNNCDIFADKLLAWYQALTGSSDLVTIENVVSLLSSMASELDQEEIKCGQLVDSLNEQLATLYTNTEQFVDKLNNITISKSEDISMMVKSKEVITECNSSIQDYSRLIIVDKTKQNRNMKDAEQLKEIMALYFEDYDLFATKVQEMKNLVKVLSEAFNTK